MPEAQHSIEDSGLISDTPAPTRLSNDVKDPFQRTDLILRILTVTAFAIAVLLGATTSSIGIWSLRQDPHSPLGLQIGNASSIRSDEYNAFSPIVLSTMATGGGPSTSPLAAPADIVHRYSSGGFFESVVFFDSTMLHAASFLPDAMVFAAHWWLPALVLFLFLPKWFEQIGAQRRWGWFAAALIALAPASSWWTMMPIQLIAYTIAGSSLLLSAFSRFGDARRQYIAALECVASGILLAGMPSFYIPWSIVLALPVFLATVGFILVARPPWRPKFLSLGLTGIITVVFAAGILWENRIGIQALLDTVYPGSRRSGGAAQSLGQVFGAPALGPLTHTPPTGTNASELSSAFTITFVWAVLLLIAGTIRIRPLRNNVPLIVIGAFAAIWLAWCTVDFGNLGPHIPLLNLVPAIRAAQVCGVLGAIFVALVLSKLQGPAGWRMPAGAAIASAFLTAYAASILRQTNLPTLTTMEIAITTAAVGLSVFAVTRAHRRTWPLVAVSVLAAVPVVNANPLIFGLGDLRASTTATFLREQGATARANNTVWASDSGPFDNVAFSNGVPSLTGLQRSGPNRDEWSALDPGDANVTHWNRGGGFIGFQWTSDDTVTFGDNGFDSISVRINPCELKRRIPNLGVVASTRPLTLPCLVSDRTLTWAGGDMHLYRVQNG